MEPLCRLRDTKTLNSLYRNYGGANQGEKMAEIRANWCQNSDMHKGAKINQAARSYLKGSYEVEMFLRISIYNTVAPQ